jgi:hypothetical protein
MPEVQTIIAEVRSDASLPFDPHAAPDFLNIIDSGFGALILWRVDVSWSQAQEIQLWLNTRPGTGGGSVDTRQQALKRFFENLRTGDSPEPFLVYAGTYLTTGQSCASYTLVLGMRAPVSRDDYQSAFQTGLNAVRAGSPGWPEELVNFLKMMLNQPSSREEFLTLASDVGDLSSERAPPLIRTLIG